MTPPATPSATPPASAEELRELGSQFAMNIPHMHTAKQKRPLQIIVQLCEEKAAALEKSPAPADKEADEARLRFVKRLHGYDDLIFLGVLGVEQTEELIELKRVALEAQWFEVAVKIAGEIKRRNPPPAKPEQHEPAATPRTHAAYFHAFLGSKSLPVVRIELAERLETELAAANEKLALSYREACRLAKSIWRSHYQADAPNWGVCDSTAGVISQIDNMFAGMRDRAIEAEAHLHAQHARVRSALEAEERLSKLRGDYIVYLCKADAMTAGFLHVHNWRFPDDLIKEGEEIRQQLANAAQVRAALAGDAAGNRETDVKTG